MNTFDASVRDENNEKTVNNDDDDDESSKVCYYCIGEMLDTDMFNTEDVPVFRNVDSWCLYDGERGKKDDDPSPSNSVISFGKNQKFPQMETMRPNQRSDNDDDESRFLKLFEFLASSSHPIGQREGTPIKDAYTSRNSDNFDKISIAKSLQAREDNNKQNICRKIDQTCA